MESGSGYVRKRLGSSPEQQERPNSSPELQERPGQISKTKISIGQIPDDKQDERERIRRGSWEKRHLYGGRRWWEQQFWL